jgi:phosphatidylinositol glycan class B
VSKRFLIRWLLISLVLHLVAVIFSSGYQNSDEHFQILEFLNAFLGRTPVSALPIEYGHMIRSWFQPFLYWIPVRLLLGFGDQNPFHWAFAIRLLSSFIGWLSVVGLALCVPFWINPQNAYKSAQELWQKAAVITLCLFWGLPALHARHSSENLSGALFVIGLCGITGLIHSTKPHRPGVLGASFFGAGILWGLSFEARYQVGFMVAGGFFWLALVRKLSLQSLIPIAAGILVAIGLGTYLDFLGYGHWTFAPWNYFHFNLIQDYVSSTDVSPWWDYFRRSWTESVPILGSLTLLGLIFFWVTEPLHFLTWGLAPLFLVHLAIGHKETRFLFPLAHAAPVCLVLAFSHPIAGQSLWDRMRKHTTLRLFTRLVLALNLITLIVLSVIPAAPAMRFYKKVYDLKLSELRYSSGQDPYTLLGIPMYFYRPPELRLLPLESPAPTAAFWYASPSSSLPTELENRCQVVTRSIPDLALLKHLKNWTLYECKLPDKCGERSRSHNTMPENGSAFAALIRHETETSSLYTL